jgi:hypothetical protein
MDHGLICQKAIELDPNIFGKNENEVCYNSVELMRAYFRKLHKYRGVYVIAMKAHGCRVLRSKGFKITQIAKIVGIHHSTVLWHLKKYWMYYETDFIDQNFSKCLHQNLYPETKPILHQAPKYVLKSINSN